MEKSFLQIQQQQGKKKSTQIKRLCSRDLQNGDRRKNKHIRIKTHYDE